METYATEAQQLAQDSCRKVLFPVVAENICRNEKAISSCPSNLLGGYLDLGKASWPHSWAKNAAGSFPVFLTCKYRKPSEKERTKDSAQEGEAAGSYVEGLQYRPAQQDVVLSSTSANFKDWRKHHCLLQKINRGSNFLARGIVRKTSWSWQHIAENWRGS